jgi:hypothetical protein
MDISIVLKRHSEIPLERLRIVRKLDELDFPSLNRAIVFIFAAWSGPAIVAFKRFTRVLAGMNLKAVDLIVVDIDCLSVEAMVALWGRPVGGGGETIWIRDGNVAARALSFAIESEQELIRNTEELV